MLPIPAANGLTPVQLTAIRSDTERAIRRIRTDPRTYRRLLKKHQRDLLRIAKLAAASSQYELAAAVSECPYSAPICAALRAPLPTPAQRLGGRLEKLANSLSWEPLLEPVRVTLTPKPVVKSVTK